MQEYPQSFRYLAYNLEATPQLWLGKLGVSCLPKGGRKGLLESALTMNIQEGRTPKGRTVFYSSLRTKSKSVIPFQFSTLRLLLLYIIIIHIASQGLRNGKGVGVGAGRYVHIT